ncbi:DUF7344 domain-containing protein [Natrialba asiatica]|uniref:DUF7344 domain-containing protein n=1 Tax=Natrialba asiatica (strain ATCC 700177 / DSM 12278 / JCM 9576 / FERM P-10747 / NBRC 102637 / 172P1) TaxID=29540 RepID=M0AIV9_NATA1|nr:hypothetical protein [Natrialba asiatica]ELY98630.1 hypothetical protein C481_16927 [Natrialba asiatica DSM 12278]
MGSDVHLGDTGDRNPVVTVPIERYDALRHPRRLRILSVLTDEHFLSLTELTTELLQREDTSVSDGQARYEVRLSLVHAHLPRLADHGLVELDREAAAASDTGTESTPLTVSLIDDPPLSPAILSLLLETDADAGATLLDRLVHPVRLRLLEFIETQDEPVSVDELATVLATRMEVGPTEPCEATIELHHNHLPALADIDAVAYDRQASRVSQSAAMESFI